uniref:Uncharacterized protein n=1 Tax=Acrobeloides nanus TaxID=290746 RepID=A0A914DI51_9BILA
KKKTGPETWYGKKR